MLRRLALILAAALFMAAGRGYGETAYEAYLKTGGAPALRDALDFGIGAALSPFWLRQGNAAEIIAAQMDFVTAENELNADYLLDRRATRKNGDAGRAALDFGLADQVLSFARDHGLGVRAGVLVGPGAPRWFFTGDWSNAKDAPFADRETLLQRMENYIRDVMTYVNAAYPGVVRVWEAADSDPGLWAEAIGEDAAELAFAFARKYADPGQKLLLRHAGPAGPDEKYAGLGEADGVCLVWDPEEPADRIGAWLLPGREVHLAGLTVPGGEAAPADRIRKAAAWKRIFGELRETGVMSASLLSPGEILGRGAGEDRYALKPAFFGMLGDESIPSEDSEEAVLRAAALLGLNKNPDEEDDTVTVYKKLAHHNPVMVQAFGADPWAMVWEGRVYLYMTGDTPVRGPDGKIAENTYGNITTIHVLSSDDLVNWQDHGEIPAAGKNGAAKWASNSWAPCAAHRTVDGREVFYLYFANSGGGIGVLTAPSPVGPFTDPLGKPLVSRATPNCASVTWLFDPAVLVDGDGSAYLYFGGGIPDGKAKAPGTARAVKLGADMISLDGEPRAIDAPWLFEDSGINKFGDTYVYSYCSNFNVPSAGSAQGFYSGEIVYMTSSDPLGPFTYAGRILPNPGSMFGVGGNNHHAMFEMDGRWYITYHAATLDKAKGWNAGYRSTFVDALALTGEGLPALTKGTREGPERLKNADPFRLTEAETLASLAGAEVKYDDGIYLRSRAAGGWAAVSGLDFGGRGAGSVTLRWKSDEECTVALATGDPADEPAAALTLEAAYTWREETFPLPAGPAGVKDLYFVFDRPGVCLDRWQFHPAEE